MSDDEDDAGEDPAADGDDPFESIEEMVGTDTEADPFAGGSAGPAGPPGEDGPFVEMAAEPIDESDLWTELTAEAGDDGDGIGATEVPDERSEDVVPKASFCERCEYFSDPPTVGCTHEGTEILELVDTDHFRVLNCPVVERRRGVDEVLPGYGED